LKTTDNAPEKRAGGFKADREFAFRLGARFPGINLESVDPYGVALVVEITDPKHLNVYTLERVLTGAAKGGIKTAVVHVPTRNLPPQAVSLFNLYMLVEKATELRDMKRVEALVKAS
jgi:hypothetical protein